VAWLFVNSFTPRLEQTTSSAQTFSKSKVWMGKYLKKSFHIINVNNVSSNIFQNIWSVLADVAAKIPKWRRWG
jgi:hypothetical protein